MRFTSCVNWNMGCQGQGHLKHGVTIKRIEQSIKDPNYKICVNNKGSKDFSASLIFLDLGPNPGPGHLALDLGLGDVEFAGMFLSVASLAVSSVSALVFGTLSKNKRLSRTRQGDWNKTLRIQMLRYACFRIIKYSLSGILEYSRFYGFESLNPWGYDYLLSVPSVHIQEDSWLFPVFEPIIPWIDTPRALKDWLVSPPWMPRIFKLTSNNMCPKVWTQWKFMENENDVALCSVVSYILLCI